MNWLLLLGVFLIIYGIFCLIIGVTKLNLIWNMGKIQGFVKILGDKGTQIFISVWGAAALIGGIFLTIYQL